VNSFIRFDDFLLDSIFSPIAEWTFAHFNISNFKLARYCCIAAILCDFYDIYHYIVIKNFSTVLIDLMLLGIMVQVLLIIRRESNTPAGTASPFRFNYFMRFAVFVFNILVSVFFHDTVISTIAMSNLLLLTYYFMSCDTPRGDRLRAFRMSDA
jgi:hypothetical protein